MTDPIFVPSRGNPEASIMLIGEAPGVEEVKQRKPFVGPAGNVLTEMLLKSGIDPDAVYYANLVGFQPPTTYPKGGGKPKRNDLSAWIPKLVPNDIVIQGIDNLIAEVARVNPNVIVPLGNWPLWFFYGQRTNKKGEVTGISDYRGYLLESRRICKGRKIIPTFHPSYYLHGASAEAGLGIMDLKRVARESASPHIVRRPRHYYINPEGQEREDLRQRLLNEGPILFLDVERTLAHRLICVGFAVHPEWAVVVSIRGREDVEFVRSLVESGKALGAQNATFDLGVLEWDYKMDVFKHLVYDTMVAAYVLNIEHKKDLGFLGSMYTDMAAWWDVVDWDKIHSGRQPLEELLPYNGGDNVVCCEVAEKQQVEMQADRKYCEAFEFDMQKVRALWPVSRRGIPLRIEKLKALTAKTKADLKENQDLLNDVVDTLTGVDRRGIDFNVKSGIAVPQLLARFLDVELTKHTPGGKMWASDNITLMEYARRSSSTFTRATIERILRVRECRDIESKFLNIEWDDDGRARCIYDPTKTVTRRLSSKTFYPTGKGDNLQNIPAPSSSPRYGGPVRECFGCDPGRKFGYADLKGAEFLIVAWLTQDPLMLKFAEMTIRGEGSVHKETAAFMFNLSSSSIDKESSWYFLGKKMRHSGNYMIGWKELMGRINGEAMETGVWVDAAMTKKMIARYIEMHPELPSWWDEVRDEAKTTGRLRNLFGFIRTINDKVDRCLPALVAFKPQSTVGDDSNYGLVACETGLQHDDIADFARSGTWDPERLRRASRTVEELRDYRFEVLLQVHDAIGFQYDLQYERQCLSRVRELMTVPIYIPKTDQTMTIPIEIQTGKAWHPLEDWHG